MSGIARWTDLRRFTPARVGLGRAGNGLPTRAHLDFLEAHARARDAVHSALDVPALQAALAPESTLVVHSAAADRPTYLLRPDLGRRLAPDAVLPAAGSDLAIVIADGLCAAGVQRHAPALLARALPALRRRGLALAPIVIARQARVAIGDPIGQALGAAAVAVLIGERPGLSAPDSLGVYLTWNPRPGRTDAERNCISNIRPEGLDYDAAAAKLLWLVAAMFEARRSGVALKDEQPTGAAIAP
jgi:ethanolamine ammonia-lyase small subunit